MAERFWVYIGKLIWPSNLCFFYPKWEVDAGDPKQYVFPAFVVLVVAVLFFGRTRLGRGPVTAVLYFGGTLFPVLGFFNVYPFRYSYVADHFQYLASIGIIVLVLEAGRSLLLRGLGKQGPTNRVRDVLSLLSFVAVGGIAAVLGGLTWSQCWVYRDHETLWPNTLAKYPKSLRRLREPSVGVPGNAAKGDWQSITCAGPWRLKRQRNRISPWCALLEAEGQTKEAGWHFRRALDLEPFLGVAAFRLAKLYREEKDLRRA